MANITVRLRHPRGVGTLNFDPATTSLSDLKVLIFNSTEVPPAEQEIKFGYPPKPLPALDTKAYLSSIPITKGGQLIITSVPAGSGSSSSSVAVQALATATATPPPSLTPAPSVKPINETLSAPTPPLSGRPSPASHSSKGQPESIALPGGAGYLELRIVPDDNSCLFSAIGVVFEGGIQGDGGRSLRKIVVDSIRADPDTHSEVMLGKPVEEYIRAIQKPDTWGGAIELSIFSKHYKTEISSFDVATGRCDRFGQDEYDNRCVLVYSGIHYDAVSLSPEQGSPPDFHTTIFPTHDTSILDAAEALIKRLKAKHYYTDTANFDLRCGVCGIGLKGEKGAREHAMLTGHVEFGEYDG